MLRCPLLVFANKQDLQGALSESELVEALGLEQLGSAELTEAGLGNGIGFGVDSSFNRPWKIQQACAVEGKGLWEGIRWLIKAAQEQKAKTRRRTKKERTETAATAATVPSNRP
jgi:ADP-ribosylation factor protein 1